MLITKRNKMTSVVLLPWQEVQSYRNTSKCFLRDYATITLSLLKITCFFLCEMCYFHVWRYHVYAWKLTWYFTGVYIFIKRSILSLSKHVFCHNSLKQLNLFMASWYGAGLRDMTGGLDVLFLIMKHKKLLPHQVLTGSSGLEITSFQWFVRLKSLHCKSYYYILFFL